MAHRARSASRQPFNRGDDTATFEGGERTCGRAAISRREHLPAGSAQINVHVMRGSRLIALDVDDRSPERAQRLAQSIVDEFFRQSRDARTRDTSSTQDLLAAEVKRAEKEFRSSQEKLEEYRAKYNAVSLAERQNIVVERLRERNQQSPRQECAPRPRSRVAQVKGRSRRPEQLLMVRSVASRPISSICASR